MCPPRFFAVDYEINPWMHVGMPVDAEIAMRQWEAVVATYEQLGHRVDILDAAPGLPDLVFTANAGLIVGDRVLLSRFRHPERSGEERVVRAWFESAGYESTPAQWWNEGEGDLLLTREVVLAGHGFRTDRRAHDEVAEFAGRPILSLELVDPRWYHLDTALAVLDAHAGSIAYHPAAFAPSSRRLLRERFPDAVIADEADALAFGLNASSDGRHVLLASGAPALAGQLADRGYVPLPIETSELQKAGGSVKCMTLVIQEAQP
jgi:N-dimethylarginine dimethylaminohydrolase